MTTACHAPSGKQFELHLGDQRIAVTEVGAALRRYVVGGVDVLDGYPSTEMCTGARGQSFVPWPNRIADGRYTFAGEEHQLPLTEPSAGNAIHGLTRWTPWHLLHDNHVSLRFGHVLPPQPGYPFALRCEITYRLTGSGLVVETVATNVSETPCPYATGAHPYLQLGVEHVDELRVRVPAATWYPTDDRGIPTERRSVSGTDRDLRELRPIGDLVLDTAFTDLEQSPDGTSTVLACRPDGSSVELWMDEQYRYVELFTGDSLPQEQRRRRSLGVEPMTAAPNAFRTGDGLVTLEPGSSHRSSWGLRAEVG
jgi:aldose 1-epimerase